MELETDSEAEEDDVSIVIQNNYGSLEHHALVS